jgi:hypothetical protein
MGITIQLLLGSLLRLDINVVQQLTSLQQDIGLVKIYGLEKEGLPNHLLKVNRESISYGKKENEKPLLERI